MKEYSLSLDRTASKAIRGLREETKRRILAALVQLRLDPYPPGMKSIKGVLGVFRIRVGEYRIIYTVKKDQLLILVLKVGHRRDVYRGL